MFLRKVDFYSKIKEDNLDVILKDSNGDVNDSFLMECIITAQSLISSYLRHFYDVSFEFRSVVAYDNNKQYLADDFVAFPDIDGEIYTCLIDSLGNSPDVSPTFWIKADPRDPMLKMFTGDIALYHLHSRINPRNIPSLRAQRRDEATKWLEGIKKGDVMPDFQKLETTDGYRIVFGTETKKTNSY